MSAKNNFISKYGYPMILLLYVAVVLFAFLLTSRFLSSRLNAAFDTHSLLMPTIVLDRANAAFATQHLGISPTPPAPEVSTSAPALAPVPVTPAPDRTTLSVHVLNATSTTGLANTVKSVLVSELAQTNVSTGNAAQKSSLTLIAFKPSAAFAETAFRSLLEKTYVLDASATLPETSEFDIVIQVGSKHR